MQNKKGFYLHAGLAVCMVLVQVLTSVINKQYFAMLPFSSIDDQWWRIITGHLVHTNTYHLTLNLTGLIFIFYAFIQQIQWKESSIIIPVLMLGISTCLGLWDNIYYYGFSAVLHGYLGYLLIRHWHTAPRIHTVILTGLILKVFLENTGHLSSIEATAALIEAPVATQSHCYGLTIGLASGLFWNIYRKTMLRVPS